MVDASIEYGEVHVALFSLARVASARPRRQKPDCEHVLKSLVLTASPEGRNKNNTLVMVRYITFIAPVVEVGGDESELGRMTVAL